MDLFHQNIDVPIGAPLEFSQSSNNLTSPHHYHRKSRSLPSIPTTNPEPKVLEKREFCAGDGKPTTAAEHKSPYDEAYSYVQECRSWPKNEDTTFHLHRPLEDYEAPFAIKMSIEDWTKLSSELERESDETWGVDQNKFKGRGSSSGMQPALAIEVYDGNGVKKTRWVLETGFWEPYENLVRDARVWLEGGSDVGMVMLVKFTETPKYRFPININDVIDDVNKLEDLGIPLDRRQIAYEDVFLEEPFGPARYRGFTWVGQITEAFMEIWIRNGNNKAIQYGDRQDLLSMAQAYVSFEGIFPSGYFEGITLDLEMFRSTLREEIQELASWRCRELVRRCEREWGLFED
ncbi:hypothetical protein GGR53DRAFT_468090 [Hypoxylon sp. FL1150]|nr:hypothetical protein GGR53DRAFT_468090 [Hypoxylon sp. FL1150]